MGFVLRARADQIVARFHLVGPMRAASTGGQTLLPRGKKARAVLAVLCLSPQGACSRSRLASLLWDRVSDAASRASLRQCLHELSTSMDAVPGLLVAQPDRLLLDRTRCWIDVYAFGEGSDDAQGDLAELADYDPERLLEDLSGLSPSFDEWLFSERSSFDSRLRAELDRQLECGSGPEQPAATRRGVAAHFLRFDPTHEKASRVLMRSLVDLGEIALALKEFERCRAALRASLDVEPSPETRALHDAIRASSVLRPKIQGIDPLRMPVDARPDEYVDGSPVQARADIDSFEVAGRPESPLALARKPRRGAIAMIVGVGSLIAILLGSSGIWRAASIEPVQKAPVASVVGSGQAVVSRGPSVTVIPFENNTGDTAQTALVEGLTQEMVSSLGRFSALRVLSRNATIAVAATDPRVAAPDYFITGNLRRGGALMRLSVQLVDARSGEQIWSNGFDVNTMASDALALQEQVAGHASSMIGSYFGAIALVEVRRSREKAASDLTPYECIVLGVNVATPLSSSESVRRALNCLEPLLRHEPGNAAAWAAMSLIHNMQRNYGFALPPDEAKSLDARAYLVQKSFKAATTAVEIAPNDAFVRGVFARSYHASCVPELLRVEAARAISLNPNDTFLLGTVGNAVAWVGFWNEGTPLVDKALALTGPSAPRFWWWASAKGHWFRGEYDEALAAFRKSYVKDFWLTELQMAYTLPFLDRIEEARTHVQAVLRVYPGFTIRDADAYYDVFCFERSYREKMREALRRAGLPD
jgi:DNA-binding SARP family transcriptional activator/TolB-like protein